jgi:signal peptidase I
MEAVARKEWPWYVRFAIGRNPAVTLLRALVWAVLIVVVVKYIFIGVRVHGNSMEPTLMNGQVKFVNRLAYLRSSPKRGDVVAIRAPDLGAVILKRVIGLPGEHVQIKRGNVFINGKLLEEPYAKGRTTYHPNQDLEQNQYYLIGDNRDVSEQYFKFDYQILGRVIR